MFGSSETHLKEHPGLSQAALARGVLVTPQSIGEIVATMESAGLVTRTPPPRPGGPISVEITTHGQSKLTAAFPLVGTINTPAALGLNGDEARTLNGLLHSVHDHVDNRAFKPLPDGV